MDLNLKFFFASNGTTYYLLPNRLLQQNKSTDEAHDNGDNNETEESTVKSVAIVKHQVVRSPANFARLECNTDLNIPPSNWLNSSINSYGFQQALSQSTGFPR